MVLGALTICRVFLSTELPGDDSELESMASVLQEVQSTVQQLSTIQQRVAAANS